jgi:hypothetical protein
MKDQARSNLQAIIASVQADAGPTDERATLEARVVGEILYYDWFDQISSADLDAALAAAFNPPTSGSEGSR